NSARLYLKVKTFNSELQKEVKKATTKLRANNERLQMMADRLAVANDKLRKLDNAKSEFISIASHQLRTPLTAIKGFVSLLLEGSYGKISAEVKRVLNEVYTSNERLIELVEDLLNISRIESGRIEYNFEEVDLKKLCQEIMDTFVIRSKEKHLKLALDLPSDSLPEVLTDRNKIREVISNLVDNALKYTPKGWVKIKVVKIKNDVQISITDTGIGINKKEFPFLFSKFSRGKDINRINVGGTGLGLYVSRKIVEDLHGKIWVESRGENQGATCFVELPIKLKTK
ncbi:MAG TPA: HAMP domain-containing histidine kinase, partial [Candidatus Moranbacteria bacterium]|nr:HAMP domain-containing histidine kinase [Candidatus Moranbacteria bacterium]